MRLLQESPMVAAASRLEEVAVVGAEHAWTWREIHEASVALSCCLGDVSAVCNLCASRVSFLVTWLAALRRGCLLILPPSGGNADLAAVLKVSASPVIVVDDPLAIPPQWRQVARCLICRPE
jgi:acyl-CoA synthetase (AMP-forming)/AMP-acid ligase II